MLDKSTISMGYGHVFSIAMLKYQRVTQDFNMYCAVLLPLPPPNKHQSKHNIFQKIILYYKIIKYSNYKKKTYIIYINRKQIYKNSSIIKYQMQNIKNQNSIFKNKIFSYIYNTRVGPLFPTAGGLRQIC